MEEEEEEKEDQIDVDIEVCSNRSSFVISKVGSSIELALREITRLMFKAKSPACERDTEDNTEDNTFCLYR